MTDSHYRGKLFKLLLPYIYLMSNRRKLTELSEKIYEYEDQGCERKTGEEKSPARYFSNLRNIVRSAKRILASNECLDSERMRKTAERYDFQRKYDPKSDPLVLEIWTIPEVGRLYF